MLAERFISRLFDQIAYAAAAHPKGICDGLAALEAATAAEAAAGSKKAGDAKGGKSAEAATDAVESTVLTEWLSSPQIRAWAQIKPALGGLDLRPYLFVTKDRKGYFGAASALGHLAGVVEKLLGPKLAVQGLDGDLKKLAPPEAAQVFEALRGRIMGEGTFTTEPPGVAGMAVLVKAFAALRPNLVDFLEGLPADKCGAWPVSGWHGVIVEQASVSRLDTLIERWSVATKNSALKTAAVAARKVKVRS
jgi:hypothetical protein